VVRPTPTAAGGAAREAKGAPAAGAGGKGKGKGRPELLLSREQRKAKKYVTSIAGLAAFGLKHKDVAKAASKRFACSAAVVDLATGGEAVDVQGDVLDELGPWLVSAFGAPGDRIFVLDGRSKRPAI
jgi:density-regulated protein DRP1